MKQTQLKQLIEGAQSLASLEMELREDRAVAEDKALIRKVCACLERSRAELEKAIGAATISTEHVDD